MDIILTTEWYKYILIEERPDLFGANESKANLKIYEKCVKS